MKIVENALKSVFCSDVDTINMGVTAATSAMINIKLAKKLARIVERVLKGEIVLFHRKPEIKN